MYFILNFSCYVLSLDSSACLGNNTLPDMHSQIFHLPKQMIKMSQFCLNNITFLQIFRAGEKIWHSESTLKTIIWTLLLTENEFPFKNELDYKINSLKSVLFFNSFSGDL